MFPVKKIWFLSLPLFGLAIALLFPQPFQTISQTLSSEPVHSLPAQLPVRPSSGRVEWVTKQLPRSSVRVITVPVNHGFEVVPMVSETLKSVQTVAQSEPGAIAILNAGFFDPVNQKSTSYITLNGQLVADPRQNERLMENANLQAYLPKILDRSELRRYRCGASPSRPESRSEFRYDIVLHSAPTPEGCQIEQSIGAGPQLLPNLTGEQEGFLAQANGQVVRDALGSLQPNARSGVGLTADGKLLLVMAAQRPETGAPSGVTLAELADIFQAQGAVKAMNLDGGSSASLFYDGELFYGQFDRAGQPVERPVKSVLIVRPTVATAR